MERKMEGFGTGEVAAELDQPYGVTWRKRKEKEKQLGQEPGVQLRPRRVLSKSN